jgi:hypothetical protein
MKGFLPGTRADVATIDTRGLAADTHPVQIGLAAAGSQDPDITLAIQRASPWYTLGDLAITAVHPLHRMDADCFRSQEQSASAGVPAVLACARARLGANVA